MRVRRGLKEKPEYDVTAVMPEISLQFSCFVQYAAEFSVSDVLNRPKNNKERYKTRELKSKRVHVQCCA